MSNNSQERDLATEQALPQRLPSELLLLILSYIQHYRDLYSLCLTCRALHRVAETVLYQSIRTELAVAPGQDPNYALLDHEMHAKLYQTIRSRGFAHIVTDFRIHILCRNLKDIRKACLCDEFDAKLGQAMLSLHNLRALEFLCWGCTALHPRHRFLTELPAPKLQKIVLGCNCMSEPQINTYQMLTSPCMAPIMSLCLFDANVSRDYDALSAESSLPHLKKLMCFDIKPIEAIFPKQTITHLSFLRPEKVLGQLHNIVSQTSSSLTYLQFHNTSHTIPCFIAMDSTPYRSLQHLGDLDYGWVPLSSTRVQESMKSLSCLPNLSSLQVLTNMTPEQSYDDGLSQYLQDADFICHMGQPPMLQTIYAIGTRLLANGKKSRTYWIWKWCDLQWRGQMVSNWCHWELINGEV